MHLLWLNINLQFPLFIKLTRIQNELFIICFLNINVIFNRIEKAHPKGFRDTEEREGHWLHVSKNTKWTQIFCLWYGTE